MKPFDLLLGELRGVLPAQHFERVCVVLESWGGQRIRLRSRAEWRIHSTREAARLMVGQGMERTVMLQRLAVFGLSRSSRYEVIQQAEREHQAKDPRRAE